MACQGVVNVARTLEKNYFDIQVDLSEYSLQNLQREFRTARTVTQRNPVSKTEKEKEKDYFLIRRGSENKLSTIKK